MDEDAWCALYPQLALPRVSANRGRAQAAQPIWPCGNGFNAARLVWWQRIPSTGKWCVWQIALAAGLTRRCRTPWVWCGGARRVDWAVWLDYMRWPHVAKTQIICLAQARPYQSSMRRQGVDRSCLFWRRL